MSYGEFQELVRRHRDSVYSFAFYSLKHREDAEDVTQEVLIRLWDHRLKLDPERIAAWLLRVTRNACCDVVRRRRTRFRRFEDDADPGRVERAESPEPGPQARAEAADFERRLRAALAELDEPYRSIVVLREVHEMKYEEIAEALGKPLNTIKVYLHRGRKMLREQLREETSYVQAS